MSEDQIIIMGEDDDIDGNIEFFVSPGGDEPKEMLRIDADGSFYVKGNKVTEDIEVYNGFIAFLKESGHYKEHDNDET